MTAALAVALLLAVQSCEVTVSADGLVSWRSPQPDGSVQLGARRIRQPRREVLDYGVPIGTDSSVMCCEWPEEDP